MRDDAPVILLSVDTLRADRFTRECFPKSMGLLEDDFAAFVNARSHGNATPLAFPGIIASHPAIDNGRFPDDVPTIAELFNGTTTGFSNNGHLTTERGYDRGFDSFHDQHPPDRSRSLKQRAKSIDWIGNSDLVVKTYRAMKQLVSDRNGESTTLTKPAAPAEEVTDFVLRRLEADDEFVWAHYMDPHKPFVPSRAVDGPVIDRTDEEIEELNSYDHAERPLEDPDDMAFIEALYDSNVRYFDRELARLLRRLQAKPWYDDAMIVFVADHGELFGEHGYMWHPMHVTPYDELIRTPLLVKYPQGEHAGESFDHLVQHSDILPTIADEFGAETEAVPDGVHPLTDRSQRHVISKSNTVIRLTEDDAVAFRRRSDTDDGLDNISADGREVLEAATFPNVQTSSGEVKGVEDIERRNQLEALGYVD